MHVNESLHHLNSYTNQFPSYSWMSDRLCIVERRAASTCQQLKIYQPLFILRNNSELWNDIDSSQVTIVFTQISSSRSHLSQTRSLHRDHCSKQNPILTLRRSIPDWSRERYRRRRQCRNSPLHASFDSWIKIFQKDNSFSISFIAIRMIHIDISS